MRRLREKRHAARLIIVNYARRRRERGANGVGYHPRDFIARSGSATPYACPQTPLQCARRVFDPA